MISREPIELNDSIIYYPELNRPYHLVSDMCPWPTIVTFQGNLIEKLSFFDAGTAQFQYKDKPGESELYSSSSNDLILVSNESLFTGAVLPVCVSVAGAHLGVVTQMVFTLMEGGPADENKNPRLSLGLGYRIVAEMVSNNAQLKAQCTRELPSIEVCVGDYPIMLMNELPGIEYFQDLYRKFIKFNPDVKLDWQHKVSRAQCHMRAHFVTKFLEHCGITSALAYKFYNPNEWLAFTNNTTVWGYHCAALIIDNKQNKWVWDPWVGHHHELLSLKDWFYKADEPVPFKLLITNSNVTNCATQGKAAYGTRFTSHSKFAIDSFQAVCGDALPFWRRLNQNGLFKANNEKALVPYVDYTFRFKKA